MGRKKKATSKPTENPETEKEKTPDLQWTDEMEAALFNAFLDQHNKGKHADLGWKNEAWGLIVEAVQVVYEGPLVITKTHCQTKEGSYKGHYKDHLYLGKLSGFNWNEELGVFEAPPEVWDELIKVYPNSNMIDTCMY